MDSDVIIVGAGPVGLMLGAELRLASASVTIVERLAAPTGLSKALAAVGRAADYMDLRGLLDAFRARSPVLPFSPASLLNFGGLPVDISITDLKPKGVFVAQSMTEEILREHATRLGVAFVTGVSVTGLEQGPDQVSLVTDAGTMTARYVVGCDGARSTIRKLAQIEFPTTAPTSLLRLGDVKIAPDAPRPPFLFPMGDGYLRVITKEPLPEDFDRKAPMSLDELRESCRRVHGVDPPFTEARWLSRFTDASGVAETYRRERVFLAGDAAHIHLPAGGPGLLTGFGDALNLGFKLGAVIRGTADPALLDSYEAERRPVAQSVLVHTRAQGLLSTRTETGLAMREVMAGLIDIPEVTKRLLSRLWQLDVRYPVDNGDHPLVGRFVPDGVVGTADGEHRLMDLMRDGRGLWAGMNPGPQVRDRLAAYGDRLRVEAAPLSLEDGGAKALLVRPDGYVAWASDSEASMEPTLETALLRWFGKP